MPLPRVFVVQDPWLYKVARILLGVSIAPWVRLRVSGTDLVPITGPVLLAINHQSDIDPTLVVHVAPRPLRFMAAARHWRHPLLGGVLTRLGAFPIEQGAADDGIRAAIDLLAAGEAVAVFPEGAPHRDGAIGDFQPGIALLALRTGAPVVPVAIKHANDLWVGRRLRRPRVRVAAGAPVDLSGLSECSADAYGQATARIMRAVAELFATL
jgi:1-acyl-sn-glycerol-3-phosphate acyltransferase